MKWILPIRTGDGYHGGVRSPARSLFLLLALLASGCGFALEDGVYALETDAIRQDSCSASPQQTLALPDASVETAGETVRIEFTGAGALLPGLTGAQGERALIGRFLPDKDDERFIADATFDVVRDIQGLSCFVFSHASIRASVGDGGESFSGILRINYSRRVEAQAACLPGCVIEAHFTAIRRDE